MSTINADITSEQSTALIHVTKASFPSSKLAKWMQITDDMERLAFAEMMTVDKTHAYLMARIKEIKAGKKVTQGAADIVAMFNRTFAQELGDYSPSVKGVGRKQAIALGMAQKSGLAMEPKPRSKWEKLTGQGKDRDYLSGND